MAKIYQYRKTTDTYTEYRVQGEGVTELVTIDGITYLSIAGDLPVYDARLIVAETVLTDELREQIKAVSTHVVLINERIKAKIGDKYDAETEMYYARIGIGALSGMYTMEPGESAAMSAYGEYVESVRQWGRDQRAELGL